jgi:hypothetical protein
MRWRKEETMTPLRLRLRKSEFDAVRFGKRTEVVLPVTSKRIHYLCFSRMTKDCNERQSACRKCFETAMACDGYMSYPFEVAIIRRGKTDKYITRTLTNVFFEWRDGKTVFVVRFKPIEEGGEV